MTGVIIAGGEGIRLRPLTHTRPKPMMPIANKPLLQYQIELLKKHGVTNIVLCVRNGVDKIELHFGDGSAFGLRIVYSVETKPLGTGGAVRFSEPHWQHDFAIIMNGDGLIDYSLSDIVDFHLNRQADVTIGLMEVPKPTHCGIVDVGQDSRITAFNEPDRTAKKAFISSTENAADTATVNAGIYVISRNALQSIPFGAECSIEKEFFPSVIRAGKAIYGFPLHGYWKDIGSPVNYLQATHDLLSGKVDAEIIGQRSDGGYRVSEDVSIAPSAKVSANSCLGSGCVVGEDAVVAGCTSISSGCKIGNGSVLDGCVLLENVEVGNNCRLRNCIIDSNCRIEDRTLIGEGSVIGADSIIKSPSLDA
ncbi:MAG TPA: NDP-sugar synthase [Armatimonadota bacterium]|nr:NDP-sugar synthase [Armatimonadota bacterium]